MPSKSNAGVKGPYAISEKWPQLPAVIDAAFEDTVTKQIYFFSGIPIVMQIACWAKDTCHIPNDCFLYAGTRFWVYTGQNVMGPRSIEKLGLPASIQKVEGALQRGKGKVLLFSGGSYWR